MGLDNIFFIFCQISLDKIKPMLCNKSTLIKYLFVFVNIFNRGQVENAEIKNSKMHPFPLHSDFNRGESRIFWAKIFKKTPQTPKPVSRFGVGKVITTSKILFRQAVFIRCSIGVSSGCSVLGVVHPNNTLANARANIYIHGGLSGASFRLRL